MNTTLEFASEGFSNLAADTLASISMSQLPDVIFSKYGLELPSLPSESQARLSSFPGQAPIVVSPEMTSAVELVWSSELAQRPALLGDFVLSGDPEIAVWAVRSLATLEIADPKLKLREVIEKGCVVTSAKIAADECLCRLDRSWKISGARFKFLASLVKSELSESDAIWLLEQVEEGLGDGSLVSASVFMLCALAAINTDWPREARRYAILLASRSSAGEEDGEMFETLLYLVNHETDHALRLFAAYHLRSTGRMTNLQVLSLATARKCETDPLIRCYLENAIFSSRVRASIC